VFITGNRFDRIGCDCGAAGEDNFANVRGFDLGDRIDRIQRLQDFAERLTEALRHHPVNPVNPDNPVLN
jgi:hypothetical protein